MICYFAILTAYPVILQLMNELNIIISDSDNLRICRLFWGFDCKKSAQNSFRFLLIRRRCENGSRLSERIALRLVKRIPKQNWSSSEGESLNVNSVCTFSNNEVLLAVDNAPLRVLSLVTEQLRFIAARDPFANAIQNGPVHSVAFDSLTDTLLLLVSDTRTSEYELVTLRLNASNASEWLQVQRISTNISVTGKLPNNAVCDSRVLLAQWGDSTVYVFNVSTEHTVSAVGCACGVYLRARVHSPRQLYASRIITLWLGVFALAYVTPTRAARERTAQQSLRTRVLRRTTARCLPEIRLQCAQHHVVPRDWQRAHWERTTTRRRSQCYCRRKDSRERPTRSLGWEIGGSARLRVVWAMSHRAAHKNRGPIQRILVCIN